MNWYYWIVAAYAVASDVAWELFCKAAYELAAEYLIPVALWFIATSLDLIGRLIGDLISPHNPAPILPEVLPGFWAVLTSIFG